MVSFVKSCQYREAGERANWEKHASCALEIGIFASHIIWRVRTRKIRKDAAAQGKTFDDIAAEYEDRGLPFKFAERKRRKMDEEARSGVEEPGERTEDTAESNKAEGS